MMSLHRNAIRFFLFAVALTLPLSAYAANYDVKVLMDTDINRSTGCVVSTASGPVAGIEQVLTTSVSVTGGTATVTGVTRQLCTSGFLGSPIPVDGGWNVGVSSTGNLFVETHVGANVITMTNVGTMRLSFVVTSGSLSDAMTSDFGDDILYPVRPGRHRAVLTGTPRTIHLDGVNTDWAGLPVLAYGDAAPPALRFLDAAAYVDSGDFFFDFDLQTNINAPTALDDTYPLPTVGGTLNVTTLGVLTNDSDPNGLALSTILVEGPEHGTLTLNADGGFTYVNDGSDSQQDHFRYRVTNGTLQSNLATVTINLPGGGGASEGYTFTSADHVTFAAAQPNSFTVTVTGKPTPALSEDGALPAGLTFVDNGDGTGTLSGTPSGTSGGIYNIVFHAEKNKPHQTDQNFTLTIGQAPGITSAPNTTFTAGSAGSFQVTAIGFPAPSFGESGALPSGVSFNSGTGTLSGTPGPGTGGVYHITFTATNSFGSDIQAFTLTVDEAPSFTSANNVHLQAGSPANFTVTTNGFPPAAITKTSGALPAGVTFTDNGNGTATIGGTPAGGSGGTYPIVFHAANVAGSANQNFTIVVCNSLTVTNPATTTGTVNAAFSQTFTQSGGVGAVAFSLNSGTLPAGLTLSSAGVLSGTPTQSGSFPITVRVVDSNGCIGIGATYNLIINCQTITVTNPGPNTGTVNIAFSQTFTASNTIGAVTFSTASTLPAGLTLSAGGVLSGTPTQTGSFPIVVKATDANGCFGNGATYTLTIGCQTITVNNPGTNSGTVNVAFSQTFTASNTIGALTFSTASTLPTGIALSSGGVLSGTPTQTGSFPIVVHVVDANGCSANGATYTLTIACQVITVNNPGTSSGTVNVAFSQTFTTTNAIGATTFTTASTLPTGLSLSTGGVLSGTPTQTGSFPIVGHVVDANGCAGNGATYTLTIACQVITVNNPGTSSGTVNVAFSQTFTATNAIGATTFNTASTLPTGLSLSTGGVLSGTPTQTGSFPIVVHVVDANGCSGNGATYTLTIACQVITVNNPGTNSGTVNSAFSQTFTTSNAIGTVTFTTASTLPTGLSLSTGGVLSGTPLQVGSFPIVVHAVDANGCSGNGATYTLTIGCQIISVTNPATTTGTVNTAFSQTFTAGNTVGTVTFTTASTLPTGLSLSTGGVLSGTPTQTGSFPIVVTATDGNGCSGSGSTYTLVIGCQTITVTNPSNTTGTVSAPFTEVFTSSNTIGAVTYSTASTLPAGLTLASNGTLSGTPTQSGTFPIVVTATDANGCMGNGATYTLVIGCQVITVNNPATTSSPAGTPLSINFTQSGSIGTATFTTASTLPAGLTLDPDGTLHGTPTQNGPFPIVVTVTDSNGCTGTNSAYTLTLTCPTITVTNPGTTTGTVNVAFSQTFTQSGGVGTTTFSIFSGTLPTGLTFHPATGVLDGTPTQTGSFPLVIRATDANGCTGDGATYTLVIGCQVITVNNPGTNSGTVNTAFSQTFTAGNTIGAVTFSLNSGTLPAGLSLSTGGVLSGTPTQTGSFPITVKATDANGCSGIGATYTLTIGCQVISVTNPSTATGTVNTAFGQTFTAGNTVGAVTFTTASTLPTGLSLSTGGVLSGTPTQSGSFPIVVTATDGNGCSGSGSTYTLVIGCQTITVTNPVNSTGTVNVGFSEQFTAGNTIGSVTFTTASALPAGITLSTGGLLSGTPTQAGSFPIVVTATDANGCSGNGATYTLVINCQTITVTNPVNATGPAGTPFSETFTQSGAIGTVTWSETGALPTGITLNPSTGVLSGTPLQGGCFPITVTVTDSNGCTGAGPTYTLCITCPTITVTNPGVSTGTAGTAFSQTFTQSGGIGTMTWSETGALPSGITLNSSTGVLSGTTSQVGTFPITVTATDSNGCQGTGPTYNLTINCQTITVTNPGVNTGTVDAPFSQTFTKSGILGTVTWTETGTLPLGVALNSSTGVLSGTPGQPGSFPITVTATDTNGCSGTGPIYTLTIACQTITVTKPGVTTGTVDTPFSQTFTQSGVGTHTPATFTLNSGSLPSGLSLSTAGVLSGTPDQPGTFPITVKVTDANGCTGVSSTYTLVIACQTITVTNPATTTGTVAVAFSQTFTQSGVGTHTPATFTTASTLPTGFTLSTAGVLSGTTNQHGTFPIVVTVTDVNGCTGTGATYNLVINCQTITVTNPGVTTGTVGTPFSQTFTQSGAIGGATFTTASTLPLGLSLSTAGVLSGTPTQSGTFPIVVTVTDGNGCTGTGSTYTLIIACNVINVTNPATTTGTAGVAFSATFTQSGGNGTIVWSKTGALPAGISLNSSTGVLSGTTTATGSFPITVTATDANGCTGTGPTYTLVINCQTVTVTNPGTTTGTAGVAFSQTFTASGILGSATWSEVGALPSGFTFSAAGVLSGTTSQIGSFPITVKATDTNGCFGTSSYTLVIVCQTVTVTNPGVTAATFNVPFSATFTASGILGSATFTLASGTLPTGMSLSAAGVLSGTPTQTGTFPITVKATDTNTCNGTGATYTLSVAPVASGDSYSNLVDNTQAVVTGGGTSSPGTPFVTLSGAIIANDTPAGGVTANPGTFATSAGGSVTIATDGTFIYTPKANSGAAATTTDTFTYTVSSNTGGVAAVNSAAATVTLNLTGRVWYVKNNGGGSNGQSQSPFTTLAAAAGASTANDIIFVYNGDGTNSGQDAGIALKNGQQLLGEINGLTVNAQTLVAAGSRPTIGNSGGAGVTVAASTANGDRTGIFIKGLSIAGTTSAISISSANAQTLTATVDNVNITAATANHGVSVAAAATLTSTVTVQNSTISGVAQNGIDAQQTTAGNLVLNINNNAVSATGTGINVVGTGSTSTTITNFASNAISGNTGGSGITVTTATFDATPGGTFQTVSGGTTTIGAAGNGVGANGMVLTNVAGDLSFTDLDIVTSNGTGLFASGTTPFTGSAGFQIAVASGVGTIDATGGAAADLSTVTANLPFTTIKSATSVSTGVNLNAVLGTFTAGSGSSITNATSTDFNISGGTATVTYDGTITDTTGRAVSVASTTGGTKTFSGAITNNGGTGISLTSNTGATINFSGTIILSTGATDAFTATGGGTVTATNTSSTLTTTTGTALNVANTTIGAGGLKFQSISAGTGASGPTSGIILNNTGSSGGLTISGTGSAGTGGTIQKMTGAGISLTSTKNVSLSFMDVQNGSMEGILGTSVDGFTLTSCSVTGNSTSGNNRDGIKLTDTVNAVTFTSDTVTGNFNSNVQLTTGGSSTAVMTTLTVTGGTYSTSTQNVGFLVDLHGSAALNTASVSGATFSGNFSKGIQFQHNDNCTMGNGIGAPATGTITVNNNTITNNDVGASFESGGTGGTGSAYYRFTNNATITGNHSLAVNFANGSTVGNGAFKVFCDSNHIGTAGVPNSGAAIGEGIRLFAQGKQTVTAVITNNTIRDLYNGAGGFDARGIDVEELGSSNTGQGQTSMDVTITGNNVDQEYTGSTFNIQYAIYVACDGQASGSGSNVHADIHGNTVPTQSACDSSPCAGNDSMIWMETVSNSNSPSGALYNLFGEASVNAAIINHNTGTAGKAAATQSGVGQPAITLTATAPNTVN